MMMKLRSILFVVAFNLGTFLQMIFWFPVYFFMPRHQGWKVVRTWGWISLWMQYLIVGTRFEFRGIENLPKGEGLLIGSKHQSTWETYTTLIFLEDPCYIVKRELMWLPFFGWFAAKMDIIGVNRGKRSVALKAMNEDAAEQIRQGRQIVIYPEGTRKKAFAEPAYKFGIAYMYENLDARVVPVALNSGIFWPRNSTRLYKGTCILELLPPIDQGLTIEEFSKNLEAQIENKTAQLLKEGLADPEFDGGDVFKGT